MFVQVIEGQLTDVAQAHAAMDRWMAELAPEASGWLGTTAGVTADGRFIALARFESAEAARHNSESPAQDKWWHEFSSLLSGGTTFRDTEDVTLDLVGDPDAAGFVQIIRGRATDPDRVRALMAQHPERWESFRPDLLGSVFVLSDDGGFTSTFYFTSEAEAREGERKEAPEDLKAEVDELNTLDAVPPEYFDLSTPWLYSPAST
ncbi:hypothetical protein ACFWUU_28435 [Kribbella sp. NPDC058693]|uniref:Antibiotic biosynthesis monooxygenase n=1 Tax=Kribbella jiaozuonensis TaxID=2575441 RepID=A0A4U3LT55_9ACTN|nr:hypothetical protein [Kribbella jiaozuonensis]TKK77667.1 hypothetical protein FDA38_21175 [Kribbella jiaozuonensis]